MNEQEKIEFRKQVARDVIIRIKSRRIVPTEGEYCKYDCYGKPPADACHACAVGGIFVTLLDRGVSIDQRAGDFHLWADKSGFPSDNLNEIEACFEGFRGESDACLNFCKKYKTDEDRMLAIFENVLMHPEGLFDPELKL